MATPWSITHSPTPRYLLIHFESSVFSPDTFSVLNLYRSDDESVTCPVGTSKIPSHLNSSSPTYFRPVERFMPASTVETKHQD